MTVSAWAQAAENKDQAFWTCDEPVRDIPRKQDLIASISSVTARGSRYDWDSLRKVHVMQEQAGISVVLELPQPVLDFSGRHLLVSVHAGPFRKKQLRRAVAGMQAVLQCDESVSVEAPPSDLQKQMSRLIKKENSLKIRIRREFARMQTRRELAKTRTRRMLAP